MKLWKFVNGSLIFIVARTLLVIWWERGEVKGQIVENGWLAVLTESSIKFIRIYFFIGKKIHQISVLGIQLPLKLSELPKTKFSPQKA